VEVQPNNSQSAIRNPQSKRILGIDPGTVITGWGVLEVNGSSLRVLGCGALRASQKNNMSVRLTEIFNGLEQVLHVHRPEYAALEETFAGENPKSAIAMGQGRGIALLALGRAGVPVWELSPAEVKKAVTGNGRAGKEQVAAMVCARLAIQALEGPADVTDALAAAIALSHRLPRGNF